MGNSRANIPILGLEEFLCIFHKRVEETLWQDDRAAYGWESNIYDGGTGRDESPPEWTPDFMLDTVPHLEGIVSSL
jgi:hypothetical protein